MTVRGSPTISTFASAQLLTNTSRMSLAFTRTSLHGIKQSFTPLSGKGVASKDATRAKIAKFRETHMVSRISATATWVHMISGGCMRVTSDRRTLASETEVKRSPRTLFGHGVDT